jgi:hypothetical protein
LIAGSVANACLIWQKIVLQAQLTDLGMQRLQVYRWLARRRPGRTEHVGRAFLQLPLLFRDLIRMHFELLRQFGQCPLAFDRCQRHLRLEHR